MIEPYQWLLTHATAFGYDPLFIGPASVDLALAGDLKQYDSNGQCTELSLAPHAPMVLLPGFFYLASTTEYITIPPTHSGVIHMRSSPARKGLGHKMAGYLDPGFEGTITLELETSMPIVLCVGERIVQLIYHRLTSATEKPYAGKYQKQRGPTVAYAP